MEKLKANIGQETSEEIEEFKARVDELIITQFDRYIGEPVKAAGRLGREVSVLNILDPRKTVIDETSESFGPLFRSAKGEGVRAGDPLEAIAEATGFGAFGGTRSVSAVGQIKGLPPKAAKAVRKAMQQELKARGPAMTAGREAEVASDMIRSTYFHGRKTYVTPKQYDTGSKLAVNEPWTGKFEQYSGKSQSRPDFRHARGKELEFGEPLGISLSTKPGKASAFAHSSQVARVMPLFGGPPEHQTVMAWTPSGGKVIKDVYEAVLRKSIQTNPELKSMFTAGISKGLFKGSSFYGTTKSALKLKVGQKEFNQALADEYLARGFKAIQYSPHRFDEFELKMFDPKDVLMVDKRTWQGTGTEPTFRRMGFHEIGGVKRHEEFKNLTQPTMTGAKMDLADWYRQIDLEKIIKEEVGMGSPPPVHTLNIKRAAGTKDPEKSWGVYQGVGETGYAKADQMNAFINKHFEKEELPSFTSSVETVKPGTDEFVATDVEGVLDSAWKDLAKVAEMSAEGDLDKFAGEFKPTDLVLGETSGTKYLGGDISEDMLSKNIKEVSLDESRIGSSFEPLEDMVSLFGDVEPSRAAKKLAGKSLGVAEEYSQLTKKLNDQYQAGLITPDELASGKKAVLSQLQKKTDEKEGHLLTKKLNKPKEGTLQEIPKDEQLDLISQSDMDEFLTDADTFGEDIGKILEERLGPPDKQPNFFDDMPSMTVGQTNKIMKKYNITPKQLAKLEELAFTKWNMKTPLEIYGFIKGTLQIKESGKGF